MKYLLITLFSSITILFISCDTKNTEFVTDKEISEDSLTPIVLEIEDTLPPAFDSTLFNHATVGCFFHLGIKTGGKVYFSETRDSVYSTISNIITNHATQNSDIVFLIDNTGSMTDDIQNVKDNLNDLIDLLKHLKNVRVAVATYGDKNVDGERWYRRTNLSSDLEQMRNFINSMIVNGGGDYPESTYDGLYKTVDELNWKSESKRMILLIGDAPGLEPPLTDHNREQTITKCLESNVKANIYPVLIDNGSGSIVE